jgi:hypothetical protein
MITAYIALFHKSENIDTKLFCAEYLLNNSSEQSVKLYLLSLLFTNYKQRAILILTQTGVYSIADLNLIIHERERKDVEQKEQPIVQRAISIQQRLEETVGVDRYKIIKRRTIYEDGQNVHTVSINDGMRDTIQKLQQEFNTYSSQRMSYINQMSKYSVAHVRTMERILTDTNQPTSLIDIALLVWMKISSEQNIEKKNELLKRWLQELNEADGKCYTGTMYRLLNVLSGFYEYESVRISTKDQIKSRVFNILNNAIQQLEKEQQEEIMNEFISTNKPNLTKLINEKRLNIAGEIGEENMIHINSALQDFIGV